MAKKSTEIVPTMLRIREDLRKRLEREAKKRDHSLNAEMVERLERSFINDAQELRDSAIVDMLVNHNEGSSELLRKFAFELAKNPDLFRSEDELKNMIGNIYVAGKRFTYEPRENPTTPRKNNK